MLRKILARFNRTVNQSETGYPLPWGMTADDKSAMQRLVKSEDFESWRKTLDSVVNSYAEDLLVEDDADRIHFLRGKIQGIRYALEIVDETHKKEQDYLAHERRRNSTVGRTAGQIRSSTFGTPSWRNPGI